MQPDSQCAQPAENILCWSGAGVDLVMESAGPVRIDPAWKRPYLLFEHRYTFNLPATIYVKTNASWEMLWAFKEGGSSSWLPAAVDLGRYKGQEILLQFAIRGSASKYWWQNPPSNQWTIRNPRIVPDHP
jgi:hypothetical protein